MKKIFVAVMTVLLALSFSLSAYAAGDLSESITVGVAKVVKASPGELFKITGLGGDSAANTLIARAVHFYNNTTIQVSDHPSTGYMFSITCTAGQYFTGKLFEGTMYNAGFYRIFDGVTFSTGICVSPTAGASTPTFIIQYQ